MSDERSRHPDAETMGMFVEGTLERQRVAEVTGHLRDCEDCRTVVSETARFTREAQPAAARRRWAGAVAAAVALIAFASPVVWRLAFVSPISRLADAAPREHRRIESRLTGFAWARLQPAQRSAATPDPVDLELAGAAGRVLKETAGDASAESLHARGVAFLLTDQHSRALAALEQTAGSSKDATIWNDLAAARYAIALSTDRPSLFPSALAAADRAIALDPGRAEAHFNRALILERIGLRDAARKQWEKSLEIDPSSGWANEAREHLRRLSVSGAKFDPKMLAADPAAAVRQFPQEARRSGEGVLLAAWADGDHAQLRLARMVGEALARRSGERMLLDSVEAIERADDESRRMLAEAYRLYRASRKTYDQRGPMAAEPEIRRAAALFARGGSPMAAVATYFAANMAFDQNRGAEADREWRELQARLDPGRHRALDAQIRWQRALYANTIGDWGTAIREADAGARIFRDLGESQSAAWLDGIAAVALEMVGAHEDAWRRRIGLLAAWPFARGRLSALNIAALRRVASRDLSAAAALLDVGIAEAPESLELARALADRARVAERGGGLDEARKWLARARVTASGIDDRRLRAMVEAQVDVAEGAVLLHADPRAAMVPLDRALAFFAGREQKALLAETYLLRVRVLRATKDLEAAAAESAAALRELETQRRTLPNDELRANFLDAAEQLIDESVDLHLSRGSVTEAFAVADRGRSILDVGVGNAGVVPPRTAVIEYEVLPAKIVIFCARAGRVDVRETRIARADLEARVRAVRESDAEGRALHALLIAPVLPLLDGIDDLVIVPDRELHAVPFAALRGERYLVEQFTIRIASSSEGAVSRAGGEMEPALVIADPRTPGGPPLESSRQEAERIASAYRARLLSGTGATRRRFLEAAPDASLIHYAGHADSDAMTSYAALRLAPETSDSGILGSSEIARLRLERHPLVVLAACGTFRGETAHVAGMPSLARSFLLAGARAVVATLWEIDDDVAAALFLKFHEHLHAGASPAAALRAAQLEMLHSSDPRLRAPGAWSAVVVVN